MFFECHLLRCDIPLSHKHFTSRLHHLQRTSVVSQQHNILLGNPLSWHGYHVTRTVCPDNLCWSSTSPRGINTPWWHLCSQLDNSCCCKICSGSGGNMRVCHLGIINEKQTRLSISGHYYLEAQNKNSCKIDVAYKRCKFKTCSFIFHKIHFHQLEDIHQWKIMSRNHWKKNVLKQ